jgi:hypothetical protein
MNPIAILFQAFLSSWPLLVIFIPLVIFALVRHRGGYQKQFWPIMVFGLSMPVVVAVLGYVLYNSRTEIAFNTLVGLLVLDLILFLFAIIVFKGSRLLVAGIAIPTLLFLALTVFSAGLSIFNTWLGSA